VTPRQSHRAEGRLSPTPALTSHWGHPQTLCESTRLMTEYALRRMCLAYNDGKSPVTPVRPQTLLSRPRDPGHPLGDPASSCQPSAAIEGTTSVLCHRGSGTTANSVVQVTWGWEVISEATMASARCPPAFIWGKEGHLTGVRHSEWTEVACRIAVGRGRL
jgi:hypothetical protein